MTTNPVPEQSGLFAALRADHLQTPTREQMYGTFPGLSLARAAVTGFTAEQARVVLNSRSQLARLHELWQNDPPIRIRELAAGDDDLAQLHRSLLERLAPTALPPLDSSAEAVLEAELVLLLTGSVQGSLRGAAEAAGPGELRFTAPGRDDPEIRAREDEGWLLLRFISTTLSGAVSLRIALADGATLETPVQQMLGGVTEFELEHSPGLGRIESITVKIHST